MPRMQRLAEKDRAPVTFEINGLAVMGLAGDTLLTAILCNALHLRVSEFGLHEPRAGFCLMGACQDCWVKTAEGERLRACTTPLSAGMRVMLPEPGVPEPSFL